MVYFLEEKHKTNKYYYFGNKYQIKMRVNILKYVLFSIVICSFEYAKNVISVSIELYFVNDRGMYLERNVTNFRNNRILADADNQFDLNEFYQSILSLVNQFNDCNDDNKEITSIRNVIDSHIKKHKESNISLNFKNLDSKTKKKINKFRTELEEVKKELDNKMNSELEMQSIYDEQIVNKDENSYVSEHQDLEKLKNDKYNEVILSRSYKKFKITRKMKKEVTKFTMACLGFIVVVFSILIGPVVNKYSNKLKKILK
ncbi:hypothetical protein YYC_05580 [Plasmodium yoelii 17X]|uniref:Fam-b protein n=1 Tax=Plasmodium yoelii 17X TaxID=1323249 RepID=V7PBR3_PLAYE|nr:hypothetical protein YYC_05580 [Plasmodium yoelii 17X]